MSGHTSVASHGALQPLALELVLEHVAVLGVVGKLDLSSRPAATIAQSVGPEAAA